MMSETLDRLALAWLKENDPEASTLGYSDRYASVPKRPKEVTASALDQVDEDGNGMPFDNWSRDDDQEERTGAYVPAELRETATLPRLPARPFREALAKRLTDRELDHFGWYEAGETQQKIAVHLGVSQKTISLWQRALLAKVDAIHVEILGRPYPGATRRRPGDRQRPYGQGITSDIQ
jgi:DNA-binding CsgD family transcriptional regulator